MAVSARMLLAGLAFMTDTVVLIISALWADVVFHPLFTWYYSFQYTKTPVIDPGVIWWIGPVYFGMLICMWLALLYSLYAMSIQTVDYQYGG
jgi:hypothetical protein